jgi:hypothetical protein
LYEKKQKKPQQKVVINPEVSREKEARASKKESFTDERGILMKYDRETHTYRPSIKVIDNKEAKLK